MCPVSTPRAHRRPSYLVPPVAAPFRPYGRVVRRLLKAVGRRPRIARSSTGRGLGPRPRPHMEAPTMPNGMRWVGLDVHAHASAVAVFDDVTGEVVTRRVNGRPWEVLEVLRELRAPARAVYEAGPTGYGLVRRARAEGIKMAVCSPGNIE